MDLQHLTNKNQEFIHIATHQLIKDGKSDEEIKAILENILPEILDNQKKGIPARTFLGAPTTWAASFTDKANQESKENQAKNTNPWLMWLDTSLLFMGVVALLNGLMLLFNSKTVSAGLISLLALSFGGGAAMYAAYHFIYRHMGKPKGERPGWFKTILILTAAMILWILIYTATAFLPATVNPQLPAIALLLIGAAAFGLRHFFQKKYNILNAMAPQSK